MVHQDPVEVRGDDHFLATVSDPGDPLAQALTNVVDKETSECDQCTAIHLSWLGQQDSLYGGPADLPRIRVLGCSCCYRDHGQYQQT